MLIKHSFIKFTLVLLVFTMLISCGKDEKQTQDLNPRKIESFYTDELWNVDLMTLLRADGERKRTNNTEFIISWLKKVGEQTVIPELNPEDYSGVAFTITFFNKEDELLYFTPTSINGLEIKLNQDFYDEISLLWDSKELNE